MTAKILINDINNRFQKGEIGEIIKNDYKKYDYCIKLKDKIQLPDFLGGGTGERIYYFYKNEIEVLT